MPNLAISANHVALYLWSTCHSFSSTLWQGSWADHDRYQNNSEWRTHDLSSCMETPSFTSLLHGPGGPVTDFLPFAQAYLGKPSCRLPRGMPGWPGLPKSLPLTTQQQMVRLTEESVGIIQGPAAAALLPLPPAVEAALPAPQAAGATGNPSHLVSHPVSYSTLVCKCCCDPLLLWTAMHCVLLHCNCQAGSGRSKTA